MGHTIAKKKTETAISLRSGIILAATLAGGVLIGRVTIGEKLWPFGTAYIAAAFMSESRVNPYAAFAGVMLSLCTQIGAMENVAYYFTAAILVCAMMIIGGLFGIRRGYLTAAVSAALSYIIAAAAFKPFQLLQIIYTVVELCLCIIMAFMLNVVIRLLTRGKKVVLSDAELISLGLSSVLIVTGIGTVSVAGVYLSGIAAAAVSVTAAFLGGSAVGAAVGLAVGMAAVMGGTDSAFLLSLSVSALIAGIFNRFPKYVYALGYLFASVLAAYYIGGREIELMLVITVALGCAIFVLLPKKALAAAEQYVNANLLRVQEQKLSRERFAALTVGRLKEISGVFKNAAKVFAGMAERREEGISYALARIPETACEKCVFYSACWDHDFEQTYALMQKLYNKYSRTGKLNEKDLGQAFLKQCIHPAAVIGAARDTFREYDINRKWETKIHESRAVLKEQMLGISGVIDSLAKEVRADFDVRADIERDIRRMMEEEGIGVRETVAQVTGRNLYVSVSVRSKESPDEIEPRIRRAVSAACGTRMSRIREMDRIGGDGCIFTYEHARMIGIVTGVASATKEGAKVSGDSHTVKSLRDGRCMMLISDGMGSGEKAAKESDAVVSLVEDFYGAGFDDETVINSINKLMILGSSEEMFSTVDLAMIDMKTGSARFTKLGAPHSYIIREGTAKRIAAGALPFGILEEMKPQLTQTELKIGDVIVMFSDGVADAENDEIYSEMIRLAKGRSVQEMAERLLMMAAAARGGAKDDMTVIVGRVVRG